MTNERFGSRRIHGSPAMVHAPARVGAGGGSTFFFTLPAAWTSPSPFRPNPINPAGGSLNRPVRRLYRADSSETFISYYTTVWLCEAYAEHGFRQGHQEELVAVGNYVQHRRARHGLEVLDEVRDQEATVTASLQPGARPAVTDRAPSPGPVPGLSFPLLVAKRSTPCSSPPAARGSDPPARYITYRRQEEARPCPPPTPYGWMGGALAGEQDSSRGNCESCRRRECTTPHRFERAATLLIGIDASPIEPPSPGTSPVLLQVLHAVDPLDPGEPPDSLRGLPVCRCSARRLRRSDGSDRFRPVIGTRTLLLLHRRPRRPSPGRTTGKSLWSENGFSSSPSPARVRPSSSPCQRRGQAGTGPGRGPAGPSVPAHRDCDTTIERPGGLSCDVFIINNLVRTFSRSCIMPVPPLLPTAPRQPACVHDAGGGTAEPKVDPSPATVAPGPGRATEAS